VSERGMKAMYAKTCPRCGEVIAKGDPIGRRVGEWVCAPCAREGRE